MTPLNFHDSWTGQDKKEHFCGGAALTGVACVLAMLVGAAPLKALLLGMLACAVVAWAKEGWDSVHPPHHPSVQDAIVTQAGGLVEAAAIFGLLLLFGLV